MKKEKKHTHGFKTPSNYFEGMEESIFSRLSEGQFPKEGGFKVPNDYFDNVENVIVEKAFTKDEEKVRKLYQEPWFQISMGIAASLLLFLTFFWNTEPTHIATEEIAEYIQNDGLDIDSQEIAQLLSEEQIEELMTENYQLSEETVESYLLDNLDDTSLLIE